MGLIARWTIGPVQPAGYECLYRSITNFTRLYDAKVVICQNGNGWLPEAQGPVRVLNQKDSLSTTDGPIGVAWKLYPPRISLNDHEIFIDNDLIVEQRIEEIDAFLAGDMTLMIEGESRMYGRFENHVPKGYTINSGLFGVPPGFDLGKFLRFYGSKWEENCWHSSKTWDEQGLVATALLSYSKHCIISKETITNCETRLTRSKGMHFVGLNRREKHKPWQQYKSCTAKIF